MNIKEDTQLRYLTILGLSLAAGTAYAAPPSTPELIAKGKASFATTCVPCHGEKGDGSGAAAAALNPKPRNFGEAFKNGDKPDNVFKTLNEGVPGSAMVAFTAISEEDRWGLTYYVLELRKELNKGKAPAAPPPKDKAAPKKGK